MLHFYSPLKTSENRMGIAYNFSGTEQSHCHYYLFCANLRLYDGYLILYDCHFLLKNFFHDFFLTCRVISFGYIFSLSNYSILHDDSFTRVYSL